MSKRSSKDDKKKMLLGLLGLVGLYFLTKASYQNDNLTNVPAQPAQTPNKPLRQVAAQTAASPNKPVRQTAASPNNGSFIAKVQKFLRAKGYSVPITGVWNTQTDKAQRAYMLKNGIFDSANFRKMVEGWREPVSLVNLNRKKK
jgi:hypothetical protein